MRENQESYAVREGLTIKPGDWVDVRVRVVPPGKNPFEEEVVVMARSHNSDIEFPILAEHVVGRISPPQGWPLCTALKRTDSEGVSVFVRCTNSNGHSGQHEHDWCTWDEKDSNGHMDE